MHHSQRGISLIQVAIVMASLAAIAMAALYGMRYERNPLLDGLDKLSGRPLSQDVQPTSRDRRVAASQPAAAPLNAAPAGVLRKCVIDGKTVFSDVECSGHGDVVKVHETHGYETPKVPAPDPVNPAASAPPSVQDQAIEKATR